MLNSVALSYYPYLHVPLMIDDCESYASLNFEHVSIHGKLLISPRIHVYLLDPQQGSVVFYLRYDYWDDYYYLDGNASLIDSLVIYALNVAVKEHVKNVRLLLDNNE